MFNVVELHNREKRRIDTNIWVAFIINIPGIDNSVITFIASKNPGKFCIYSWKSRSSEKLEDFVQGSWAGNQNLISGLPDSKCYVLSPIPVPP